MSRDDPWSVLEIPATRDSSAIRRAYARRLKLTNPEDDAEGFQALRQAYEQAMRAATAQPQAPDEDEDFEQWDDADWTAAKAGAAEPLPLPTGVLRPATVVVGGAAAKPSPSAQTQSSPANTDGGDLHRRACERLAAIVADASATTGAVREALEAVLRSPDMDQLGVFEHTQQWLAWLALGEGPQAPLLSDPLIEHFHWRDERFNWRPPAVAAVLHRHEEGLVLLGLARARHRQHRGFVALSRPAGPWRRMLHRLTPGLALEVSELLAGLQLQWPRLLERLDAGSLAWWQAYLGKAQLSPALFWTLTGLSALPILILLMSALATRTVAPLVWLPPLLLAPSLFSLAWLYAVARRRPRQPF